MGTCHDRASAFVFLIHTFVGTREIWTAAKTLEEGPALTLLYGWHVTTMALLVMTLCFAAPLVLEGATIAFLAALLLAALSFVLNIGVNVAMRPSSWTVLPQWVLFGAITLSGGLALV